MKINKGKFFLRMLILLGLVVILVYGIYIAKNEDARDNFKNFYSDLFASFNILVLKFKVGGKKNG